MSIDSSPSSCIYFPVPNKINLLPCYKSFCSFILPTEQMIFYCCIKLARQCCFRWEEGKRSMQVFMLIRFPKNFMHAIFTKFIRKEPFPPTPCSKHLFISMSLYQKSSRTQRHRRSCRPLESF